jgi:hypothetical protein
LERDMMREKAKAKHYKTIPPEPLLPAPYSYLPTSHSWYRTVGSLDVLEFVGSCFVGPHLNVLDGVDG